MNGEPLPQFMARLPRRIWRLLEWAARRRSYPWWSSPPHLLLSAMAQNAYAKPSVRNRVQYAIAAALLKFRQRLCADNMNFSVRLQGPVTAEVLRNMVLWQFAVLKTPPLAPKPHANLHVIGEPGQVQIDRLMSLLLISDVFENINVVFDEKAAHDSRFMSLTVAEELHPERIYDLNSPPPSGPLAFDDPAWSRIFSMRTGFAREVNGYLKTACPGAFIVALGLMESDDGFCDDCIASWEKTVRDFSGEFPKVTFVVLSRVGPETSHAAEFSAGRQIAFARRAGLTLAEAICLAQKADAYVGVMNLFGLAARAARRPGIYMDSGGEHTFDAETGVVCGGMLAPRDALEQLKRVLANSKPNIGPILGKAPCALNSTSPINAPPAGRFTVRTGSVHAVTAPVSRADDMLDGRYTLVIPTYNRHDLLMRLLGYLDSTGARFPILVLDSSMPAAKGANARAIAAGPANVRHISYPQTIDPYVKMREGFREVRTPYCSMCADDDIVIVPALNPCLQALENDPDAVAAHGYYFNFVEAATFDLSFVVYRGASLESQYPLARLRALFANYEAILYGVTRTTIAQRIFRDIERIGTVLGRELLTASLTAIHGKVLRIPSFYYGRSTGESMSYTAWHPHQILAQSPAALFAQHPVFRELLLEALSDNAFWSADLQTPGMLIDLIMLRYLAPFLRSDVLDLVIDSRSSGDSPEETINRIWNVFVRTPDRTVHQVVPLIDPKCGLFAPKRMMDGDVPLDYAFESQSLSGKTRHYRVLFEFLFPDLHPPAVVTREQLLPLFHSLDAY